MWWPQLEFINTGTPDVANRTLDIAPDGSVTYNLSVTATFRSDLDLRRFPFDRETLEVRIQSFIWTRDQMIFVPDPARIGFIPRRYLRRARRQPRILRGATARDHWLDAGRGVLRVAALIEVKRRPIFYLWTVFAPVILIFLISCAIFAVDIENLHDRIGIGLTALLACIAMQFTVSFNLPQVSYLTVVGWMFLVTYFCITLAILIARYRRRFSQINRTA